MTALAIAAPAAPRRAASPYARRLAREGGVPLDQLSGSGPAGRVVAADVLAFTARPGIVAVPQVSALGADIALAELRRLEAAIIAAGKPFAVEDMALRAAACALDDVPATATSGARVALEESDGQIVFADIRDGSLARVRSRRLTAAAGHDQDSEAASLSLRLLAASGVRPLLMPLLPSRAMRLVLVVGADSAECLLTFDATRITDESALEFLVRFKDCLETPLRLLA